MKKKLLFLILTLLFAIGSEVKAQYELFQEKTNFVFFAGTVKSEQTDQFGQYYGFYADYLAYKSADHRISFGPYGVISRSDSRYWGGKAFNRNLEYGGGLSFGYYEPDFSFRHQSFLGFSLGIIKGTEKQERLLKEEMFEAWQNDLFLSGNLNFNLLKAFGTRPNLLPRSQIQVRYKHPLKATKVAYWEREPIETYAWDKSHLEILAKQSIYRDILIWRSNIYYSPKLVLSYNYSKGDKRDSYGLGFETALAREYRDDFLSLGILYKVSENFTDNYFIVSLQFNLSSLLAK